MLASQDEAQEEIVELQTFQSYRVDGLLIVPPRHHSRKFLTTLASLDLPTVALDRPLGGRYSTVTCNNIQAATEAVQHLLQHGRRRILCLGGDPNLNTIQERMLGYKIAIEAAGLVPVIVPGSSSDQLRADLQQRFSASANRPDAIFALYNDASVAAYEFLIDSSFTPAVDVALLGFDDFPLAAALRPAISVVRQPIDEIARAAAEILFGQIESASRVSRQVTIAAELVLRASCGCPYDLP